MENNVRLNMGAKYSRPKVSERIDEWEKKKKRSLTNLRKPSVVQRDISENDCTSTPVITDYQRTLLVDSFANLKQNISQIGVLLFLG